MKTKVMICELYRANSSCSTFCMGLDVSNIYDEVFVVAPDYFHSTSTEIDLDVPQQEILQIVTDEEGMHAEPYWATPESRLPPKGYCWIDGGTFVRVGRLKNPQENHTWHNLEFFVPVWDQLKPISSESNLEDEFCF